MLSPVKPLKAKRSELSNLLLLPSLLMRVTHSASRAASLLGGLGRRGTTPAAFGRGECRPGSVYLVGAGPGDASLLTLRAAQLLGQADAIVYDRLVGDDVLALIPPGRERYYVGKARGQHSVPQAEIGALLVKLAGEGKSVVRLKGGDPGVFGRMGEELAALAEADVPAEIVPGITAASGAAAAMGMALTDRAHAQQLRFITAQLCREGGTPDWASLARTNETLVFYMGLAKVEAICHGLRGAGLPDDWPILLIANASLPDQQSLIGTLADMSEKLAKHPLPSPCLIVVGSVVRMAEAARLKETMAGEA
ncbi:uroporphyrin-III C-methyltransferase [Modicisalibacter muralis]|uniref:uroporphyrinogen-III C-methyltransferase n=1 Tax=Modicisalibacter muralis TaxID=119000 RepID=A0A1G9HV93_9GAMM|nr:uroporphyrinogen-III C-methyltransferase [Halomonas muralis]SDL16890.1 uroporphyrin-III C-methyltransferase [Halomonas muralis]